MLPSEKLETQRLAIKTALLTYAAFYPHLSFEITVAADIENFCIFVRVSLKEMNIFESYPSELLDKSPDFENKIAAAFMKALV